MKQYLDLITRILHDGEDRPDRTGVGTRSIFGHQMRFDLNDGFPLVTAKRTFWRGAFTEMLWMLRGDTNIEWLHQHGVTIWDEWADENFSLGPVYGAQWRDWDGSAYGDQLADLINQLATNPHSRRHILTAWNVSDLPLRGLKPHEQASVGRMALAPCHMTAQFYVSADYRLSCQLYQRSCDAFLGLPFNIAGYALLTHMLAHRLGYGVGDLVWTGGDCHLYHNHLEQAEEMLKRDPRGLSTLRLNYEPMRDLWDVEPSEIDISGYHPHPAIKAPVAV